MIFEKIQKDLEAHSFEIVAKDHDRPWGGFFVIAEEQAPPIQGGASNHPKNHIHTLGCFPL